MGLGCFSRDAADGVVDDGDQVFATFVGQSERDPDVAQFCQHPIGGRQLRAFGVSPGVVIAGEGGGARRPEPLDMHAELIGFGTEGLDLVVSQLFEEELEGTADELLLDRAAGQSNAGSFDRPAATMS